jgi:CBS domain-containing protein
MERLKVKDLMVPVERYCTVSEDVTLYDAVIELETACKQYEASGRPYRAVLVCDKQGKVIGKLSQLDVLRSLEPRYTEMGDLRKVSGFGISAEFLHSVMEKFELWQTALDDMCRKAMERNVAELVRSPLEGEVIDQEAPLNRAIHQLVVGHFQSLLVTSKGNVVGVLRLVDVFHEVTERMKLCKI